MFFLCLYVFSSFFLKKKKHTLGSWCNWKPECFILVFVRSGNGLTSYLSCSLPFAQGMLERGTNSCKLCIKDQVKKMDWWRVVFRNSMQRKVMRLHILKMHKISHHNKVQSFKRVKYIVRYWVSYYFYASIVNCSFWYVTRS